MKKKTMMTTREVADYFKMNLTAIQKWRHRGTGPPFTIVASNCTLYSRKDVLEWEKKRLENSGGLSKNKDPDPYGMKASVELVKDICGVDVDSELGDAPPDEYTAREAQEFRVFKRRAEKIHKKFR